MARRKEGIFAYFSILILNFNTRAVHFGTSWNFGPTIRRIFTTFRISGRLVTSLIDESSPVPFHWSMKCVFYHIYGYSKGMLCFGKCWAKAGIANDPQPTPCLVQSSKFFLGIRNRWLPLNCCTLCKWMRKLILTAKARSLLSSKYVRTPWFFWS